MRIYTPAGDLAFKTFTFPDGQPHFILETIDDSGFRCVTIETALQSPTDLFTLTMVTSVLRSQGFSEICLDIRYLLGARMDRAISSQEPFTLALVAQVINACGFSKVRILDVHSEVATRLIRNSVNVLPFKLVEQVYQTVVPHITVCPDKGAKDRTRALAGSRVVAQGDKKRDMATGVLTGFSVERFSGTRALIIDDLCDGGGTFSGLAKAMRAEGATYIALYVTHGIFSKGINLEGIDHIYTTNSLYQPLAGLYNSQFAVIPISMKELL